MNKALLATLLLGAVAAASDDTNFEISNL